MDVVAARCQCVAVHGRSVVWRLLANSIETRASSLLLLSRLLAELFSKFLGLMKTTNENITTKLSYRSTPGHQENQTI